MEQIVIIGYYKGDIDWREREDEWGRMLRTPIHGPIVFCGYWEQDPEALVEVYLRINEDNMAIVSMYDVELYGQEVRFIAHQTERMEWLEGEVDEYECLLFRLSNDGWHDRREQPYTIQEDMFQDSMIHEIL